MSRSPVPLILALVAVTLVAVPAAFAKGRDARSVRIQGACTQQATSKLKLSREDHGIEVELEVDQNRNGLPWTVTLRRNGNVVTSLEATTRAPSGSFEIRRVIAGRFGTDRIVALATSSSGETCTAGGVAAPKASVVTAAGAILEDRDRRDGRKAGDGRGREAGDDHGRDREAGDDHGRHSGRHS